MDYALLSGEPKEEKEVSEIQPSSILSAIQTWFQSLVDFVLKPPATRLS
jgi:hypothetical protein